MYLREIDFATKNRWLRSPAWHSRKLVSCVWKCTSLNHLKVTKAEPARLILPMLAASLQLLIVHFLELPSWRFKRLADHRSLTYIFPSEPSCTLVSCVYAQWSMKAKQENKMLRREKRCRAIVASSDRVFSIAPKPLSTVQRKQAIRSVAKALMVCWERKPQRFLSVLSCAVHWHALLWQIFCNILLLGLNSCIQLVSSKSLINVYQTRTGQRHKLRW